MPGDLGNEAALREAVRAADVVFHLGAAMTGAWEVHRETTVEGTRRLLEACRVARVRRFVLVSSLVVYDKRHIRPEDPIDEEWPLAPRDIADPYACGKIEAEALVRAAGTGDMETVIARPGLIYGPGRTVFPHLGVVLGNRFVAVGRGDLLLPLVHVDSVVDALIALGTDPAAAENIYQVVDDDQITRAGYLELLYELSGHRYRTLYLPVPPVALAYGAVAALRRLTGISRLRDLSAQKLRMRAVEARYDTSKLRADTGWRPRVALRDGLAGSLGVATDASKATVERAGIIGAGRIAALHLQALKRLPGVRVTGILDLDPDAAASLAARFGVERHFADADRFYEAAAPQLVHVLTPPHTHAAVALDAIRRGVHVLVEKPAVLTVEDCDAIIEAARGKALSVGVDENFAFAPHVRKAIAMIARGDLGDLVHISAFLGFDLRRTAISADASAASSWYARLPGGVLEDLLPHVLSVTFAASGRELEPVHWSSRSTGRLPHECADELRLSLAGGDLTADVGISLTPQPDDFMVTVYGTRATLRIDLQNMLLDRARIGPGPRTFARGARVIGSGFRMLAQTARNAVSIGTGLDPPPGTPLHLIRAHYAALSAGRELPAPIARVRRTVEITRQIWPMPEAAEESFRLLAHMKPIACARP
jgi:predicted dehydrogenase/nucleoside-diphosphate-sugar epimerase